MIRKMSGAVGACQDHAAHPTEGVCWCRVSKLSQYWPHISLQELLMRLDKGSHVPLKNRLVCGHSCNTISCWTKIQHSNAPRNALMRHINPVMLQYFMHGYLVWDCSEMNLRATHGVVFVERTRLWLQRTWLLIETVNSARSHALIAGSAKAPSG